METSYFTLVTGSDQETIKLGRDLGSRLREGDVVALAGELGAGKTWFAKGLALGLGVDPEIIVTSPSFALVNEYPGRIDFIHMDAYRLESLSDFISAGLEEYLHNGGVVAIEWADRWPEVLPEHSIRVAIKIIDDFQREIAFEGGNARSIEIIEAIKQGKSRG